MTGRPTCTFAFAGFLALDRPYGVTVVATRSGIRGNGRVAVTIRDLLVVGLGDSYASGEGNPDSSSPVRWQDRRCHRSARSFEALTAARLEAATEKSSVTFVSLACSGASIPTGMLGGYAGIEPSGGGMLPPQVAAMQALIGRRTPTAVLVSIGINDLGFGSIARFCFDDGVDQAAAATIDCWSKPFPKAASPATLQASVRALAALLPARYAQLAAGLQQAGIPTSRVYVTEYPSATRDAQGNTCNPLIPYLDGRPFGYSLRGMITRDEAGQAESELLLPSTARSRPRQRRSAGTSSQESPPRPCRTGCARVSRGCRSHRFATRPARCARHAAPKRPGPAGNCHLGRCRGRPTSALIAAHPKRGVVVQRAKKLDDFARPTATISTSSSRSSKTSADPTPPGA